MRRITGHKGFLFLVLTLTVAVLCTLPFLFIKKQKLYVYTNINQTNTEEQNFIKELKHLGLDIVVDGKQKPTKNDDVLWLSVKNAYEQTIKSEGRFIFIYSEEAYPLDWQQLKTPVIMLTPHQKIYEHYMRSNVPSAKLRLTDKASAKRFYEIWKWLNENRKISFVD